MDKKTFLSLIDKYLDGAASPEERVLLEEYADQLANTGIVTMSAAEKAQLKEEMLQHILQQHLIPEQKVIPFYRRTLFKIAAAAAIIIAVGLSTFLLIEKNTGEKRVVQEKSQKDIYPGHDGAILTLADGHTIVLDNAQDGKISDEAVKNGNKVSYQNNDQTKVESNTMTTPKGRQFSLILADGTQVWLNAASSITYPTAFTGSDRKVSITGEAYFEVAHNAKKPFHVQVNGMDVQVLGTHFNINAYSNEGSIKTTLLQGSIKISAAGKNQLVKPGQQTQVTGDGKISLINDADVNAAVAWKNGFFQFNEMGIESVMRQLERWYNIDVKYEGQIPNRRFAGQMDRSLTLSEILKILQESNVHFKLEDRTLIVTP
jgi:hypothetical protein